MGLPKDLVTKSREVLKRPNAPTVREVLAGNREPRMSDERRAGVQLEAILAGREADETERVVIGRRQAKADAEAARDKAILAAWENSVREAIR